MTITIPEGLEAPEIGETKELLALVETQEDGTLKILELDGIALEQAEEKEAGDEAEAGETEANDDDLAMLMGMLD